MSVLQQLCYSTVAQNLQTAPLSKQNRRPGTGWDVSDIGLALQNRSISWAWDNQTICAMWILVPICYHCTFAMVFIYLIKISIRIGTIRHFCAVQSSGPSCCHCTFALVLFKLVLFKLNFHRAECEDIVQSYLKIQYITKFEIQLLVNLWGLVRNCSKSICNQFMTMPAVTDLSYFNNLS